MLKYQHTVGLFSHQQIEKFILFKLKLVPNMASALLLISQGALKINNKRIPLENAKH